MFYIFDLLLQRCRLSKEQREKIEYFKAKLNEYKQKLENYRKQLISSKNEKQKIALHKEILNFLLENLVPLITELQSFFDYEEIRGFLEESDSIKVLSSHIDTDLFIILFIFTNPLLLFKNGVPFIPFIERRGTSNGKINLFYKERKVKVIEYPYSLLINWVAQIDGKKTILQLFVSLKDGDYEVEIYFEEFNHDTEQIIKRKITITISREQALEKGLESLIKLEEVKSSFLKEGEESKIEDLYYNLLLPALNVSKLFEVVESAVQNHLNDEQYFTGEGLRRQRQKKQRHRRIPLLRRRQRH